MNRHPDSTTDVVIVGAGPVGLLTAVELTLAGMRVQVLDRLEAPSTVMKALGIGTLGGEALQRRGMSSAMAAVEEQAFAEMRKFVAQTAADPRGGKSRIGGHFGGLSLIRRDAQKEPDRRARLVDQQAVESMLADRARALGVKIHRGYEVTNIVQEVGGLDVKWESSEGKGQIRCAYLVGCDGGRSFVRKRMGFDFPGTAPTMTMYTAIAEVEHPEGRFTPGWTRTSGGVFAYGPVPKRLFMLDFSGPPKDRETPVTREEVEGVLRRVSGVDVRVKVFEAGSRWTDNTRLVDTYRRERVLLAGDAAHIHSPFGGQGMSLGLVDAANLGWKLAAVIHGEMPESLLDTYTAERRPVAESVLANTLAQAAIMRPDPQSGAMREIMAKLMEFDDVNRFIGEMMSGLASRYDLGSDEDAVGRLMGDRTVSRSGGSLYDLMQDGAGVLLDASSERQASSLTRRATKRVRCVAIEEGPSMLIRPDACIAWIGEDDGVSGLEEALRRWFVPADWRQ